MVLLLLYELLNVHHLQLHLVDFLPECLLSDIVLLIECSHVRLVAARTLIIIYTTFLTFKHGFLPVYHCLPFLDLLFTLAIIRVATTATSVIPGIVRFTGFLGFLLFHRHFRDRGGGLLWLNRGQFLFGIQAKEDVLYFIFLKRFESVSLIIVKCKQGRDTDGIFLL